MIINGEQKGFSFLDDTDKMRDFFGLTEKEFLRSYSYLTEYDYEATVNDILNKLCSRI